MDCSQSSGNKNLLIFLAIPFKLKSFVVKKYVVEGNSLGKCLSSVLSEISA